MKNKSRSGFTLTELVVVVLIVAILTAVAVPQYKVAVARVRYLRLQNVVRQVMNAQQRYWHANGDFTVDLSALDVQMSSWKEDSVNTDDEEYQVSRYTKEEESLFLKKVPHYLEIRIDSSKMLVGFTMFDWHYPDMEQNPEVRKSHLIESYCNADLDQLVQSRQLCKSFGAQVNMWPNDTMWKF